MNTGQTLIIIVAVNRNVKDVLSTEFLHHLLDVGHALSTVAHGLGGVVGVAARAVPVSEKLRSERYIYIEILSNTSEEVTGHVHVVTNFNTSAGSDLVLPLTGHDLSIGARNFDASVEAGFVVSIGNKTSETHVSTSGAVVGSLLSGVSVVWPSKGVGSELGRVTDEGVLLLNTIPGLFVLNEIVVSDFVGEVSEVGVGRDKLLASVVFPAPTLTEDKNVVAKAEGVTEVSYGLEDDLGLISDGLVS